MRVATFGERAHEMVLHELDGSPRRVLTETARAAVAAEPGVDTDALGIHRRRISKAIIESPG